jgi:hypothetical protein
MIVDGHFGQVSTADYAAQRILYYAQRFHSMSRAELMQLAFKMKRSWGFCSEKMYYLRALREECAVRGINFL